MAAHEPGQASGLVRPSGVVLHGARPQRIKHGVNRSFDGQVGEMPDRPQFRDLRQCRRVLTQQVIGYVC